MNWIKIFLFIIFMLSVAYSFVEIHEITHQTIFKYYGCDSEIVMFDKEKGYDSYTKPADDCIITENMKLAHSINEVVGYQVMPFIIMIFLYLICRDIDFKE